MFIGQTRTFLNAKTSSWMTGKPSKVVPYGRYGDAVAVEVGGCGHYTGECSFGWSKVTNWGQDFSLHNQHF